MSFSFCNDLPRDFTGTIWVEKNKQTGKSTPKTSMGMAFVYLPFFLIGHIVANIGGYTTYGYSEPYSMMLAIGCCLYVFLGLFYLRKILLVYFNDVVTTFTLFSIVIATNLFYYTTIEAGMSHAYSFSLITFFIWNTIQWHQHKRIKTALFLGLLMGIITLVRPTNGLIALVFMFYGVGSFAALKSKAILFWDYKKHIILILIFSLIVWLPQLIFWKYATNSFLYFSYGKERFFFSHPHIIDGLFSYRKGWLLYTPIMIFAILGIVFMYKKQRALFFPVFLFLILNIYVIFSWWSWFYGGGFSCRPMVDFYALLALPLAAFYTYFDKKRSYFRSVPLFIIFLTGSLNLFQTQQTKTCLHWAGMTKEAYWTNFTTLGWPEGIDDMLKEPDNESLIKGLDEYPEEREE